MGPHGTLVKYPTTGKWGPQRENPPPPNAAATPCACVVLASCLQHACYKGKTTKATRGMTVAECRPSPEDIAAGWGGSGERVRDEPHDRAQREHAPCKPRRGDHRGCDRRKGRVTTGATWQAPPHLQRDKCRASCLRRACDVLTPEDGQRGRPPPHPLLLHPPKKGARTARRQREDVGGGKGQTETPGGATRGERKKKEKKKDTNTPDQGQTVGADGTWREPGSTSRGAGKGDAPGDES